MSFFVSKSLEGLIDENDLIDNNEKNFCIFRLPTGNDLKTEWWQRIRHTDLFRQEIARRMFYESHTVRNMLEVEYGFENESLIDAAKRFKKGLTKVDKNLPKELQLLHDMACSIQF